MSNDTTAHVTTISGMRYQGIGTYDVTCTCGHKAEGFAYHKDAKGAAAAHVAQATAGMCLRIERAGYDRALREHGLGGYESREMA